MVQDELGRQLGRRKEAADRVPVHAVGVGDIDQLVIARHAFLLHREAAAGAALDLHLVQLEVAIGADHRVDLSRHQRGREREVDVDQRHVVQPQPGAGQHRGQQRLLDPGDGIADAAALQVGQRRDRAILQHQKAVQRRRHQRSHPDQRQPFGHLQVQLRLVRDRKVGAAGGDHLRRVSRIGGGDDLDRQALIGEIAVLLGDQDRAVVGVHEPVQHQGELVLRPHRGGKQQGSKDKRQQAGHSRSSGSAGVTGQSAWK